MHNQRGVIAPIVALSLVVLIGAGAMAIDIGHLVAVHDELQRAADAGALAGAGTLYNSDGTAVLSTANQTAKVAAMQNYSEKVPVEVNWSAGNTGDVQRGHWSFATRTFTPNDSLLPVELWNVSTEELDADVNFINAVKVRTRREATPAVAFLAKIFGVQDFTLNAEAISYIGFSGTLQPSEAEMPIAICRNAIIDETNSYNCNYGRMIDGNSVGETGAWTDFNQEIEVVNNIPIEVGDPCSGGTNQPAVTNVIENGSGNESTLYYGNDLAVINGQVNSAYMMLYDIWWTESNGGTKSWSLRLPVIDCDANGGVTTCAPLSGSVTVTVVWMSNWGNPTAPVEMDVDGDGTVDYSIYNTYTEAELADMTEEMKFQPFAEQLNLMNLDGQTLVPLSHKTIYFLPSCEYHEPAGLTGGENYGVLAKYPVLVD